MRTQIILAAALVCGTAHAEFYSGNDLYSKLTGNTLDRSIALGYVIGVSDALIRATHCAPKAVTAGQIQDMIRDYLDANPAVRHFSADSLISHVLKTTWPCANRQGGTNL